MGTGSVPRVQRGADARSAGREEHHETDHLKRSWPGRELAGWGESDREGEVPCERGWTAMDLPWSWGVAMG